MIIKYDVSNEMQDLINKTIESDAAKKGVIAEAPKEQVKKEAVSEAPKEEVKKEEQKQESPTENK